MKKPAARLRLRPPPTAAVLMALAAAAVAALVIALVVRRHRHHHHHHRHGHDHHHLPGYYGGAGAHYGLFERYEDMPPGIRHWKNDAYYEFFKYFYSSGAASPNDVLFMPSVRDTACTTLVSGVSQAVDCSTADVNTVSTIDNQSNLHPMYVCGSANAARQPSDKADSMLRILEGLYTFAKTCITLKYTRLDTNRADDVVITLPARSVPARFIMMNRPVFLAAQSAVLYAFVPLTQASTHDREFKFTLRRVTDTRLWVHDGKALTEVADRRNGELSVTLYYLKYAGAMTLGAGAGAFNSQRAATLAFYIPQGMAADASLFAWGPLSVRLRSSDGKTGTLTATSGGTTTPALAVHDDGFAFVTFATDLIIVSFMARDTYRVTITGGAPPLAIDSGSVSGFAGAVQAANAGIPAICAPYTTHCVPSMFDIYTRLFAF